MTEDPYLTRIEEYLDESLPDALTAEVEAHLAQCADCRGVIEEYRRLRRIALAAPVVPIPDDLGYRIRQRLRAVPGFVRPTPRERWLHLAPMLAGAVAAAILFVLVLPFSSGPEPASPAGGTVRGPAPGSASAARPDPALDRVLGDWLVQAQNSSGDERAALLAEARDLSLLERVRAAIPSARGRERAWLRASEDLIVQLVNDPDGDPLAREAGLVAEVGGSR